MENQIGKVVGEVIGNLTPALDVDVDDYEKYQAKIKKESALQSSGVGRKYWGKTFDDVEIVSEEMGNNIKIIKKFIEDTENGKPRTMWFCGNAGTGKTLLASIVISECGGRFVKSYEILNELEDCRSFKAQESKTQLIKRYSKYNLLVIDEIGKVAGNTEVEYLFMILNERYENEKSTILITNKSAKELGEYIGKPMLDRFTENCSTVKFTGSSYRIKERDL